MGSISIRASKRFVKQLDRWEKEILAEIQKDYPLAKLKSSELTESLGRMMENNIIKSKGINISKKNNRRRKKLLFEVEFPL